MVGAVDGHIITAKIERIARAFPSPEFGVAIPAPVLEFACEAYQGGEIGYRMHMIPQG